MLSPVFSAVNCVCLAQLLSLSGCVAFCQISHLERSVSAELLRRRRETEEREEKERRPSSKSKVMSLLQTILRWRIELLRFTAIVFYLSEFMALNGSLKCTILVHSHIM